MAGRNGIYGQRHNAPYAIVYSGGVRAGKERQGWTEQEQLAEAQRYALACGFSLMSFDKTTRRYCREMVCAYLAGVSEGQGHILSEEEWTEKYGHSLLVYERMRFGNSLDQRAGSYGSDYQPMYEAQESRKDKS